MCERRRGATMLAMSPLDYILDSTLVLLVLIQIKERELTTSP